MNSVSRPAAVLAAIFLFASIGLLNGFYKDPLYSYSPAAFWIADGLNFVVLPIICLCGLAAFGRVFPRDYGFRAPDAFTSWGEFVGLSIFITFMFWLCYVPVTVILFSALGEHTRDFSYSNLLPKEWMPKFLVAVYFSTTAALVEETVFRALPWLYIRAYKPRATPVLPYAVVTSIFFGYIHWENGMHEVIGTMGLGFMVAVLYTKIENIWPFVTGHFLTNMITYYQ